MPEKCGPASTIGGILAKAVEESGPLFLRYVRGFDDVTAIGQVPGIPNHVVWTLGHCGFTMHRVGGLLDGAGVPLEEYFQDQEQASARAFQISKICRGSIPVTDPGHYPGFSRAIEIFKSSITRFSRAVAAADEETLESLRQWHDGPISMSSLIRRVCFHTATHAGQITDLRRAMGMPTVIGAEKNA